MNRRRAIELASTIPLLVLAGENVLHREGYVLDVKKATLGEGLPELNRFVSLSNDYDNSLNHLVSAYYKAYRHSRTVSRPCFDSEGDLDTCIDTEYYWDGDENIVPHETVFSWRKNQNQLTTAAKFLAERNLVDANQLDKISITREGLPVGMAVGLVAVYGAEISGLLGYEEMAGFYDSKEQISRRAFFKCAASLTGAATAYALRPSKEESRSQKEGELAQLKEIGNLGDDDSFTKYFGVSIGKLWGNIIDNANTLQTFHPKVEQTAVKRAYEEVLEKGSVFADLLERGVPEELTVATRCGLMTKAIDRVNKDSSPWLEALAVGGVMAAVLIPSEIINQKKR